MDYSQVPLSMGFARQEYWSGLPFLSPGDLANPGIEPVFPALAGTVLYPPGKPRHIFSSVQLLSRVQLFAIPWTAARQASLSIPNSQSLLKFMSIESVITSNHLILCHPLLLLPSIFTSIRVFSSESALHIKWPTYWSFSFSICLSSEYSGLISFQIGSDQLLSRVRLFATPWITVHQASLSITNSRSSLRLTSIESVMLSSHLILCRPLLLLPPIPPSISLFQWVNSSHEVAKVLEFQL